MLATVHTVLSGQQPREKWTQCGDFKENGVSIYSLVLMGSAKCVHSIFQCSVNIQDHKLIIIMINLKNEIDIFFLLQYTFAGALLLFHQRHSVTKWQTPGEACV